MLAWFVIALIAVIVGLVCAVGGIWALLNQKVVVDESGHVSEIEIPWLGKFRSNYPSLVAVCFGVVLTGFVVNKITVTVEQIPLEAALSTHETMFGGDLVIGAIPSSYRQTQTLVPGNEARFLLSVDRSQDYQVVAFTMAAVNDGQPVYTLVQSPAVLDRQSGFLKAACMPTAIPGDTRVLRWATC